MRTRCRTGSLPTSSAEPSGAIPDLVQTFLDHLVVERGVSVHTAAAYRRDLRRYTAFLAGRGVTPASEVTPALVGEFLGRLHDGVPDPDGDGWLETPLAAASVARAVVAVRSLHRFAAAEGLAADDPARTVHPPRPARRLPKALNLDQVQAMLDVPSRDTP